MFTYTKRELRLLALSISLFILLIYNLAVSPLITLILNKENLKAYSNYVYSRTIPISSNITQAAFVPQIQTTSFMGSTLYEKQNNEAIKLSNVKTNSQTEKNRQITEKENAQTQRSITQEYKNIKWRIEIPKINLDVHIMEGTSSDILLKAVGHFTETSKWSGNVGLAAHNRGYNCNFFEKIKNLKVSDEIIYTTINGKKVYKVQTNKIIKDTDWSYLKNTKDNRITLITCEENRAEYRRCIQAIEIANYKT